MAGGPSSNGSWHPPAGPWSHASVTAPATIVFQILVWPEITGTILEHRKQVFESLVRRLPWRNRQQRCRAHPRTLR